MIATPKYSIGVTLTTRTGDTRRYSGFKGFINDWRFFFSSGKESCDEKVFDRMISALVVLNEHGASMEVIRNGLIVKLTYDRFSLAG